MRSFDEAALAGATSEPGAVERNVIHRGSGDTTAVEAAAAAAASAAAALAAAARALAPTLRLTVIDGSDGAPLEVWRPHINIQQVNSEETLSIA